MTDFSAPVSIASIRPFNVGLSSASEETMIKALGMPKMPLTTDDQPDRASDMVKKLEITDKVAVHVRVTGVKPAVESLRAILAEVAAAEPDLIEVLRSAGMLVVRLRRPTSGKPSTKISNHAWGTAIDFSIAGHEPVGDSGKVVPLGIAKLVPHFNKGGWFSGIDFKDDMHFEVANETIGKWIAEGKIGAGVPVA